MTNTARSSFRSRAAHTRSALVALFAMGLCALPTALATGCSAGAGEATEGASTSAALAATKIRLKTSVTGNYLMALNGGGSGINAASSNASTWETFTAGDLSHATLTSGDQVQLAALNGQYVAAENGGGGALNANRAAASTWETFVLTKVNGSGAIANGDLVTLRTTVTNQYLSADNGGGGAVTADRAAAQAWEQFVLEIVDAAPTPPTPDAGTTTPPPGTPGHANRIIGYLPNWNGSYASWASKIDFTKLTHVYLAFANAGDSDNNLSIGVSDQDLKTFVDKAHAANVKVVVSIGGGGGDQSVIAHYRANNVDAYAAAVAKYVTAHDFDGVDVDVEAPGQMGAPYATFVQKLGQQVRPTGKLLTAAVARWIQGDMPDSALREFDFINIMSYGTYDDAVSDLVYYNTQKGLSKDKLVMGAPFYADCTGSCGTGTYLLYREVLQQFPNAWQSDRIQQNGSTYTYQGEATMKRRAITSKDWGGIMFWEISGDAPAPHSLLDVIAKNL